MAISRMQRLTLILAKEKLDALLQDLQGMAAVDIYDLTQLEDWQAAFDNQTVTSPPGLLADLEEREDRLEGLIKELEAYLPAKTGLKAMREKPVELSLSGLEAAGQERDEDALLAQIQQHLQVVEQAQAQIQQDEAAYQALEKWQDLQVTPRSLAAFQHLQGLVGSLPSQENDSLWQQLKAHPDLDVEEVFSDENEQGILVFYKTGAEQVARQVLATYDFKALDYDLDVLPAQHLAHLRERIKTQQAVLADSIRQLQDSQEELLALQEQVDYLLNRAGRERAKASLAATRHLVVLQGWVEADRAERLQDFLRQTYDSAVVLELGEIAEKDWEQVPTKLTNPGLIEPFELVTEMYALPKYGQKDPTPLVSLFYFVFFGMMVADMGYGLLLFLGTSLVLRFLQVKDGLAKNLRFFRLLSVSVILWGLIYGSFFGFELPFALLSTSRDIMPILVISVIFGFITILVGLWLSGQEHLRLKDYAQSYNAGFAWVLILLGLALYVLGSLFPGLGILTTMGQWLVILNGLGILLVSLISSRKLTGLIAGLFNLYSISSYVGDLVSFTRLMALGLAGASMGSAFNLIVELFPPIYRYSIGLLAFVLLHLVNMSLALLSGYVHSARLIFVEYFGKFYEGGGKPFKPLKAAERYVRIKRN